MASQSSRPLKGGAALEGVDYVNLQETGDRRGQMAAQSDTHTHTLYDNTGRLTGYVWTFEHIGKVFFCHLYLK